MPVAGETAALQFFTEAMRANTAVIEGFREESREDRRLLHDIHTRVVKMESQNVATIVADLARRVDALESEKDQRHGARSLGNWIIEKSPSIGAILVSLLIGVVAALKATGRL